MLSTTQSARLRQLDQLTPGDFANVFKRYKTLGLDANGDAWLDEREFESLVKPGWELGVMGFTCFLGHIHALYAVDCALGGVGTYSGLAIPAASQ